LSDTGEGLTAAVGLGDSGVGDADAVAVGLGVGAGVPQAARRTNAATKALRMG
jgi:hypothetical protein